MGARRGTAVGVQRRRLSEGVVHGASRPLPRDRIPRDKDTLNRLWRGGAGDLPDDVRKINLPPSGRCEALVYEFFRATDDDPPVRVADSRLTGPQHLAGAGLWPIESLVP